jgi:predicted phage terminase large subunit-like protein
VELANEAQILRENFPKFIRAAWHIVEPATPLIWSWHIDAIVEHLAAVSSGKIQKLLINIPPGHMKSLLACVFWPSWVWTWLPAWRGLFCSYAADLALRDSVKCRSIIESTWYQERFCVDQIVRQRVWRLEADQNAKSQYRNTYSGERMALGVGGKGTGFRGNCVLVDDPHNATEAVSKTNRESVKFWWTNQMSSRVNDPRKDAHVIIMQRLHEDDLSGHVLDAGGYEHLCLPSEFSSKRKCRTSIGFQDPRVNDGDLLFPELFTREVLKQAKKDLGTDGFAGQHDQLPNPEGGGMFKREWWRYFRWDTDAPVHVERPKGANGIQSRTLSKQGNVWDTMRISVDCSFKDISEAKKMPDSVSITVWGARGADRFLLYRFNKPIGFSATLDATRDACKAFPKCYKKLVEAKANGSAVINVLSKEITGIVPVEPEGGKEARANAIAPQVEAGNVYLWEGLGTQALEDYVGQFAAFPRGRHDDDVDSTSQALLDIGVSGANRTRMITSRAAL